MKLSETVRLTILSTIFLAIPAVAVIAGEEDDERPPYTDRALNLPELEADGGVTFFL